MIFYFSGTGNSAWVARQLAEGQNEELLSIAMEIDRNKAYKLKEGEKVGFVFPVYAWGPPKIVLRFIHQLKLDKPGYLFFVCTCGDDTGRTAQIFFFCRYPERLAMCCRLFGYYAEYVCFFARF